MILAAVNLDDLTQRVIVDVSGLPVRVGRQPEREPGESMEVMQIPWRDRLISRTHFVATREADRLIVQRMPALPGRSRPNAFYSNAPIRQRQVLEEPLRLQPGQAFTIGALGTTAFYWLKNRDHVDAAVMGYRDILEVEKEGFNSERPRSQSYDELTQLDEYSLRLQLKLIQRDLPEQVLRGWTNETQLFTRAGAFLETALPGQKGVSAAFLAVESGEESVAFHLLNPDPQIRADFRPSRTLLSQLNLDSPNPADIHIWTSEQDENAFRTQSSLGRQIDWVAAIPVASMEEGAQIYRDPEGRPVYLYVETRQSFEAAATAFVPFLRLVASLVASLLSAREKQRIQDQMSAYFSPTLREVLQEGDQAALEPAMVDCTVLFADRRGHSRILELARTDEEILAQLRENQKVVGRITQKVFDHDGVITDFAGDGALALWGWPTWLEGADQHPRNAVATAEAIVQSLADRVEFEVEHRRLMSPVRIGISSGRIAVGKTGPRQQWHISVFGSVANLGARLERIAKEFKVPVLLSGETVNRLRWTPAPGDPVRLFRKLCLIRPAGFAESYPIYELVLPLELGGSGASAQDVSVYEHALDRFLEREWDDCIDLLKTLPETDEPARWLLDRADLYRLRPPEAGWGGEIASLMK
ncbi:MAG: adenylate/guanylate cyclase domain-containing protein [Verrucomicrobiales bacterium]|nr:adenylate/guanylate cyclase domain-containing protein [Verrucomicrobiales bacterium]